MTENVYWILKGTIGEGNQDAVKELAQRFSEKTNSEEGVIAYEWSMSADGSQLHVYERFKNSDAALAHLGNVGPDLPELLGLVTPTAIECYGSPNDAFKAAVGIFPVSFFETFQGFHR